MGSMLDQQNTILQLTDTLTARTCVLRIEPGDSNLPLSGLLEKYLERCPIERFREEGRITDESSETLQVLQDLAYACSDDGRLAGLYAGVEFTQGGLALALDDVPGTEAARVGETDVAVLDVGIDRTNVGYDRNWAGFHRRRWDRNEDIYSDFIQDALGREHSNKEADEILHLGTRGHRIELVRSLARRIWESEFENYSRFVDRKLPYKTGDETVRNIVDGAGGICSEKVQALKFLTDHYGFQSEYLIAGADTPTPVPEDRLRELLTTFDFRFAKRHMRYWQHTALLYTIDGATLLVDATNGNIPFLFLQDDSSEALLGYADKKPVRVRMAVYDEDFYYHRVSQDIPENLFFAMEGWVPDVDLVQVFDNELGLYISADFFVTPIVFKNEAAYERLARDYTQVCDKAGLECSVSTEWTLDAPLGIRLAEQSPQASERILRAEQHLLARYNQWEAAEHHAGLVLIALQGDGDGV